MCDYIHACIFQFSKNLSFLELSFSVTSLRLVLPCLPKILHGLKENGSHPIEKQNEREQKLICFEVHPHESENGPKTQNQIKVSELG